MNNFETVFKIVKKHCKEVGAQNLSCFDEIETTVNANKIFLSARLYLEIFQDLELIKYCPYTKGITLTEKGHKTDHLFNYEGGIV